MADVKKTLEIEAVYDDLASAGIDKTAQKIESVGQKTKKAGEQGASGWDKFNAKALTSSDRMAKISGVAGTSFAAVGASMSLATAKADQMGMAAAGAAGSIAAGFGSGGPVGGAVAIAAAGLGLVVNIFSRMGDEAKEAADKATKAMQNLAASVRAVRDAQRQRLEEARRERAIQEALSQGRKIDIEQTRLEWRTRDNLLALGTKERKAARDLAKAEKAAAAIKAAGFSSIKFFREKEVAAYNAQIAIVRKLRSTIKDLAQAKKDEVAIGQADLDAVGFARVAEAAGKAKDAVDALKTTNAAAAKTSAGALVVLGQTIAGRKEALTATSNLIKWRKDMRKVVELEAAGEFALADALRQVVRGEEKAAKATKDRADASKAAAEARGLSDLDFRGKRAEAGGDQTKQLALRHEQELANHTGTRAQKEALVTAQKKEQVALSDTLKKQATDEATARKKATEDYLKGLKEAVAKTKAEASGTLKIFEIRKRIAEAIEKGGAEGLRLLHEQLGLEKKISEEKQKQEKSAQKRGTFESNLAKSMSGPQDKGLASRRSERRARLRMRKGRREGRLDADGNRIERGIRGQRRGGFGVIAGGTAQGLGDFSSFSGGAGDMDSKGSGDAAKETAENTGTQAEQGEQAAETQKKIAENTKQGVDTGKKIADALESTNTAQGEAATQRARVHDAARATATAAEATATALGAQAGTMDSLVSASGKVRDEVLRQGRDLKRLLDSHKMAPS